MNAYKINVPLMIPLNGIALEILNRYNFKLPMMVEGVYNRQIKELLRLAKVTTIIEWRSYDDNGKKIFKSANICDEFSNHCCSRTAIKHFFSVGYTPDQVCRIVGKSLDTIMSYYLEKANGLEVQPCYHYWHQRKS